MHTAKVIEEDIVELAIALLDDDEGICSAGLEKLMLLKNTPGLDRILSLVETQKDRHFLPDGWRD